MRGLSVDDLVNTRCAKTNCTNVQNGIPQVLEVVEARKHILMLFPLYFFVWARSPPRRLRRGYKSRDEWRFQKSVSISREDMSWVRYVSHNSIFWFISDIQNCSWWILIGWIHFNRKNANIQTTARLRRYMGLENSRIDLSGTPLELPWPGRVNRFFEKKHSPIFKKMRIPAIPNTTSIPRRAGLRGIVNGLRRCSI